MRINKRAFKIKNKSVALARLRRKYLMNKMMDMKTEEQVIEAEP